MAAVSRGCKLNIELTHEVAPAARLRNAGSSGRLCFPRASSARLDSKSLRELSYERLADLSQHGHGSIAFIARQLWEYRRRGYSNKNTYYHKPSDTYFQMIQRGGRYFQRQYQIGFDGKQTPAAEKEIDFVLGSGNHVRTYLHRTANNTLVQLPLAWYAEKGGYWAMNPGYDRPDHQGSLHAVSYDCMFCHNAYPGIPAENGTPRSTPVFSSVPEGIDCQRCHGDGEKHVALASKRGSPREEIRKAIVNPARLTQERQMEVCMQCHLKRPVHRCRLLSCDMNAKAVFLSAGRAAAGFHAAFR